MDDDTTVSKEQYNEIVEKLADATQSKVNLVAEIQELREKKQITEAEAEELRTKLAARTEPEPTEGLNPEKVMEITSEAVRKILADKDLESAKANKKSAMAAFQAKYKEFHPENDEGGLRLAALERELNDFNLGGLVTEADFMTKFEKARSLVVGIQAPTSEDGTDPNPLPPNGGGNAGPREAVTTQLTSKEMKIVEQSFGGDKDRYLKIKAKRPDYVASLLQYLV